MKLSIVGVGRVGSAIAYASVLRGLPSEMVLVGRDRDRLLGDVYDLQHAVAFIRPMDICAGDIEHTAGSDVIVLSSSVQLTSFDRNSIAGANAPIVRNLAGQLAALSPNAVMIVITNPVDVMAYVAWRASGFDASRVIGTGTLLDTGRFRALLSQAANIHSHDIRAYILGEHGDSQFPALSVASYGGVRYSEDDREVRAMAEQAREGGKLVFRYKGHTNYAIATATVMLIAAIRDNTREVFPVSTLVDGFCGVSDVFMSLPCVIGRGGVIRTLPVDLNEREAELFRMSAEVVRSETQAVER
jgi:L-lactate dehydrogenase